MILLRDLSESDLKLTFKWHNDPELASQIMSYPPPIIWEEELKWFQRISKSKHEQSFKVIEYFGQAVGFVTIQPEDIQKTIELGIAIGEESSRGRGLGAQVLKKLIDAAKKMRPGYEIFLLVRSDNLKAISFYLKNSFVVVEHLQIEKHSLKIEAVRMKLFYE